MGPFQLYIISRHVIFMGTHCFSRSKVARPPVRHVVPFWCSTPQKTVKLMQSLGFGGNTTKPAVSILPANKQALPKVGRLQLLGLGFRV